jgi:dihydroorotate dehydrogenase
VIVGSSIGKNFDTPNAIAYKDYLFCLDRVYEFSDYIAVNISSPNTKDLRDLSSAEYFDLLIKKLKLKQNELAINFGYKPILIKISPDEDPRNLREICSSILENQLDGIICTNTSIDHQDKNGPGGLSGTPLNKKALCVLLMVKEIVGNEILVIASGGIMSAEDYQDRIVAGADLVQLYTGFIYEGPKLIKDIVDLNSN